MHIILICNIQKCLSINVSCKVFVKYYVVGVKSFAVRLYLSAKAAFFFYTPLVFPHPYLNVCRFN